MKKTCSNCKMIKMLDAFHKLKQGKMCRHSHCKECRKKHRKLLNYERPIGYVIKCLQCDEIKPETMFYKNRYSSLGVQPYCIQCHKEKIYESQSKLSGYITKLFNKLVIQCKKKNIRIAITKDDIIKKYFDQEGKCILTEELLTYYSGPNLTECKYETNYNIAIDRIDPSKDYTIENIQLLGKIVYCMKIKTSMNNTDFVKLCKLISENNLNS